LSLKLGVEYATNKKIKASNTVRWRFIALAAVEYTSGERETQRMVRELATKSNAPLKAIQTFT
jgi:hypothetical protein